jgi:predicted RNA-binding protein
MNMEIASLRQCIETFIREDRAFAAQRVSDKQLANIEHRIRQVRTQQELDALSGSELGRLVRMVWPLARFVDRE